MGREKYTQHTDKNERYVVPEGTTEIESNAFIYRRDLKEIVIPDSVTDIGWGVFEGCSSLKRLICPERLIKRYEIGKTYIDGYDKEGKVFAGESSVPEGVIIESEESSCTDEYSNDDLIKIVKFGEEKEAFMDCPSLEFSDFSEAAALKIMEKDAIVCDKLEGVDNPSKCKVCKEEFLLEKLEAEERIKTKTKTRVKTKTKTEIAATSKIKKEDRLKAEAGARAKAQDEERELRLIAEYDASRVSKCFNSDTLKCLHKYDYSRTLCRIPEWAERIASYTAKFDNKWIKTIKVGRNLAVIEDCAFLSCPNLETIDFSEAAALKTIERYAFIGCDKLKVVGVPSKCKVCEGAFPTKCKIKKIKVKKDIQPVL